MGSKKYIAAALAICLSISVLGSCQQQERGIMDPDSIHAETSFFCQEFGSRVTGSPEEQAAAQWLRAQLEGMGYSADQDTLRTQPVEGLNGTMSENLIVRVNPRQEGDILCVTAHYDSVPGSPGARDNVAAVAILLELSRELAAAPIGEETEIRLLFLGAEETGYHGSRVYLESLSQEELSRHKAAFNMDISAATKGEGQLVCCTLGGMTDQGYQEGNFLEPMENAVSRAIAAAAEEYDTAVPVVHGGESDHVMFHQWQIDTANVCWRRVEDGLPVLPPEYHGADDLPDTIDYTTAELVGNCVYRALCEMAQ